MKKTSKREKNKGITLIALIITIIVLLILAGVSITTLTGENGLLEQAQNAKESTEKAELIERAQTDILTIQAKNYGDLSREQLKTVLDKYFDNVPEDYTKDSELTGKDEYGKYIIKVSDIYDGILGGSIVPAGLEVGSIVTYTPSGTYEWEAEYCSSTLADDVVLDSSTDNYKINQWRVFEIDKINKKVTLVPIKPIEGKVYLGQAQGYNNGVYLLIKACESLYGDTAKGIKARNINIEDIEKKMTEQALQEAHSYVGASVGYGEQEPEAYTTNSSKYPSIYAKEILSVINQNKNNSGLSKSEQTSLIKRSDEGAVNGQITTATSIQPYLTSWSKTMSNTAFRKAENGISYYDLIMPKETNTTYWIASRGVQGNTSGGFFAIYCANTGKGSILGDILYLSDGNVLENRRALFPVVSLNSELIMGNATDGFSIK